MGRGLKDSLFSRNKQSALRCYKLLSNKIYSRLETFLLLSRYLILLFRWEFRLSKYISFIKTNK